MLNAVTFIPSQSAVNGFCYSTRPVAKSLLPDPTRARGLITRPDPNPRVNPQTSINLLSIPCQTFTNGNKWSLHTL